MPESYEMCRSTVDSIEIWRLGKGMINMIKDIVAGGYTYVVHEI